MMKTKNTLIICAYVLLMTLFFFGGYAAGGMRRNKIAAVPTPEPVSVPVAAVNPDQSVIQYELILDHSELFLYKKDGEDTELLYSHPISENIFPREDMEELKNGVYFETLEDAQSLLENFVS